MPLTTRCRRCGRLFPVYAQQLKVRRGRVDCPQCSRPVDAVGGLLDEAMPGTWIEAGGRAFGGRRLPAATAPAALRIAGDGLGGTRRLAGLLWPLGILLLSAGLIAQVAWWERAVWQHQPQLRAALEGACAWIGCRLPLPRIAGTMEIRQPALGEHPQDPQALRLTLTLINRAPVTQRLPLLQLELYDREEVLAAARRFSPDQYYPPELARQGIAPGAVAKVELDLALPATPPAGFRVRLL